MLHGRDRAARSLTDRLANCTLSTPFRHWHNHPARSFWRWRCRRDLARSAASLYPMDMLRANDRYMLDSPSLTVP